MKVSKTAIVFSVLALVALCVTFVFIIMCASEIEHTARSGYRYCSIAMMLITCMCCFIACVVQEHHAHDQRW